MPTTITTDYAVEKSTFIITAAFTDSAGSAVTPNVGLNWTLTTPAGTVINSRSAVTITPDTSVDIVLSGLDLAMQTGESGDVRRIVTVQGTYDSTEGSDLPIKDQVTFLLKNLVAVT